VNNQGLYEAFKMNPARKDKTNRECIRLRKAYGATGCEWTRIKAEKNTNRRWRRRG